LAAAGLGDELVAGRAEREVARAVEPFGDRRDLRRRVRGRRDPLTRSGARPLGPREPGDAGVAPEQGDRAAW
jgi:hypothetical protein